MCCYLLGSKKLKATASGSDLHIKLPKAPAAQAAHAFALTL